LNIICSEEDLESPPSLFRQGEPNMKKIERREKKAFKLQDKTLGGEY